MAEFEAEVALPIAEYMRAHNYTGRLITLAQLHERWAEDAMTAISKLHTRIDHSADKSASHNLRRVLSCRLRRDHLPVTHVMGAVINRWTQNILPGAGSAGVDSAGVDTDIMQFMASIGLNDVSDDELRDRRTAINIACNPHSTHLHEKVIKAYPDDACIVMSVVEHSGQGQLVQFASDKLRNDPTIARCAAWTAGAWRHLPEAMLARCDVAGTTTFSGELITEDYLLAMHAHWNQKEFVRRVWRLRGFVHLPLIMSVDMRKDTDFLQSLIKTPVHSDAGPALPADNIDCVQVRSMLMLLSLMLPRYAPGCDMVEVCRSAIDAELDKTTFNTMIKKIDKREFDYAKLLRIVSIAQFYRENMRSKVTWINRDGSDKNTVPILPGEACKIASWAM